jgi:hypothetical protein
MITVRAIMDLSHILKETPFYQFIREEAFEEGFEEGERRVLIEVSRKLAAKYFPDLEIGEELEQFRDLVALEQLCLDLYHIPNADALRARLAALITV